MVVEIYDVPTTEILPELGTVTKLERFCCLPSFIDEGKWKFIRREPVPKPELTKSQATLLGDYRMFIDIIRERVGLERLTYKSAQFTMSPTCPSCGSRLKMGFASCPNCRAVRPEFKGLERYVSEETGFCALSAAATDVKGPDGKYYWAPYFLDMIRAWKFDGTT
jgi:hypothetical protein